AWQPESSTKKRGEGLWSVAQERQPTGCLRLTSPDGDDCVKLPRSWRGTAVALATGAAAAAALKVQELRPVSLRASTPTRRSAVGSFGVSRRGVTGCVVRLVGKRSHEHGEIQRRSPSARRKMRIRRLPLQACRRGGLRCP
ncbi:unnamed protein product, partial [Pylaiella littoralis]